MQFVLFGASLGLLILLISAYQLQAQSKVYQLKADTVRIFNTCDTAELVLENRTRFLKNAVLTNKGNGVTEFASVMRKLGDSGAIIGGDTILFPRGGQNIYNTNGTLAGDRLVDGSGRTLRFNNTASFSIANKAGPVILSRTPMDSAVLAQADNAEGFPFAGLVVRGNGCDACVELLSDSAGSCNEMQSIDFATLRPRMDSWLTQLGYTNYIGNKYLLGRIALQTNKDIADYSRMVFAVKSDTAFFHDGSYILYTPGYAGGYTPYPIISINPSFRHPTLGYHTRMPWAQINGGLFVGFGRNWYFNSRNANDIIPGVDDVAGYLQPFYDTRFSVYADSLPFKFYKLPSIKGSAFLTYTPTKTVEGNNVAYETKDSVYEDIRRYIVANGLITPSDRRLKEDVVSASFDISRLMRLPVKEFAYRADSLKHRVTGLVAQDVQELFPELVGRSGEFLGVDYIKMVPYLLKAIQQQELELVALRKIVYRNGKKHY